MCKKRLVQIVVRIANNFYLPLFTNVLIGNHIPAVMDSIPSEDRCPCQPKVVVGGQEYPPKAAKRIETNCSVSQS
ncbi:unnamed protein product [Aureobasidium pullulans]|nr:unnamed protein product [Aureobasidium pullulans]CAD0057727.1 unnamed protein product [Aureobasidium pullulans]